MESVGSTWNFCTSTSCASAAATCTWDSTPFWLVVEPPIWSFPQYFFWDEKQIWSNHQAPNSAVFSNQNHPIHPPCCARCLTHSKVLKAPFCSWAGKLPGTTSGNKHLGFREESWIVKCTNDIATHQRLRGNIISRPWYVDGRSPIPNHLR